VQWRSLRHKSPLHKTFGRGFISSSILVVLIHLLVTASSMKFQLFCQKTVESKQFANENDDDDDDDEWKTVYKGVAVAYIKGTLP
jgi:hypothetical protein